MQLVCLQPPRQEPVSVGEAKQYLRIDHEAEDELLANLIQTARSAVEDFTQRSLMTQVWQLTITEQPSRRLPFLSKKTYPGPELFPHNLPFLIKDDKSHEAEGVYFVEDRSSLSEALDYLTLRERSGMPGFVTQEFVPSGGNVLRAVIIGKRVITYWKRPNKPGQVITTISRDAIIDSEWKPDLQEKGKEQAHVLTEKTGINLAAVDFVFPLSLKRPAPSFLEINYYFGRRGLGGTENYYRLLYQAVQDWLLEIGLDPKSVRLV